MDTSAINKSCENESGQHNLKRKRDQFHSNQTKSSNIQTTLKDLKKSTSLSKNIKISSLTNSMRQSRKRKFVFPEDEMIIVKKNRKFYFLNDTITKPRQHKLNNNNDIINNDKSHQSDILPLDNIANEKLFKKHKLHFSVTDNNGNCYLVHKNYMKNDLFCSDETKHNYDIFKRTDLYFHIIDEIALEGLDGITIEALWKRLKRVFSNNFSKTMAEKVWKIICSNKQISFYVLEQPRDELVFYDRTKCMDLDNGRYVDPFLDYKDIYPIATVSDSKVKGSCSTFNTRKENNSIRRLTLDKVQESYGQKLVLVADQTLRNKSLIYEEADPTIEFVDVEYCLLERIGRGRYDGELTHGKISLQSIQNDSRTLYHNKKVLMDNHLTTHQFFYLKSYEFNQNISGGLMHLTRFYNRHRNKQLIIMERLANYLRDKPKNQVKFTEFREIFGRSQPIVKLQKTADFQRFFKILILPYRALYPNAPKNEWLAKSRRKERSIRMIKLIDPHVNIAAVMDNKDSFQIKRETAITTPGCKFINYEYLRDVFWYIAKAGLNGVTLHEIHDYFKVDFYSLRTTVKKLMIRNVIYSQKIDLGRQHFFKFIAKYLKYPQIKINLTPKEYELDNYTIMRILKSYEKPIDNKTIQVYNEPDVTIETPNDATSFTINFNNFRCNVFLNDFLDPTLDELNIYDIINKGRDRLLLAQSNLFKTYCGEWENFHLKKPDFLKFSNIFTNGFGKIIYDYLNTLILANNIEIDNKIIFNLENFVKDVRYRCILPNITKRLYNCTNTCRYFYNNCYYEDLIGKLYLFECLFNENHTNRDVLPQFKDIVKRVGFGDLEQAPDEQQECVKDKVELQVINNVIMEKFMGNQPIKVYEAHCNDDNVNIEIFQSTPSTLKRKNYQYYEVTNDKCLTQRFIDRTNLILKTINEQKIIKEIYELLRLVREHENLQGYDKTVCRKSINTIIQRLIEDGYIKVYKVIIKNEKQTKGQTFVCELDVNYDHPIITGTIDEIKMKFHIITTKINQQTTIQVRKQKLSPFSFCDVKTSINELKQLTSSRLEVLYKYNKNAGYKYGYSPKFVRMRILHEFLFYLIYEQNQQSHQLNNQEIYELCKNYKIQLRKSDLNNLPSVYCKEISWKMFVPPLPIHQNWPKGWALVCDIILRLPLSVFVKLFNICYNIPELEEILNHPIKRHFLLKHIDNNIKNVLLLKRKYLHHVYDTICNMCYIGLIQLGPKSSKEKDQIFIYLNRRASLLDTTTSEPGYNQIEDKQYKKLCFEFKTVSNVEFYWSEMWRICLNTRLGKRKIMEGQFITIEDCLIKQQMIDTLKQKTPQTAVLNDNGETPGDHRGAAGLDSALWSYVKRNWSWNMQQKPKQLEEQQSQQIDSLKNEKLNISLPKLIQYDLINTKNLQQKVYLTPKCKGKQNKINTICKFNVQKKCKILRKIPPRKNRIREYYDNIDKAIMKKNRQTRVEWDDNEDFYLRFLRVALLFLCPLLKRQMITYTVIRDVLHRIYPKSRNKTSKAIQRRLCFLLATDEILRIMETNVENFLNSEIIAKYFGQIHNRYQSNRKYTDAQLAIAFIYFISYIKRHSKEIELLLLGYIATVDFFSHPYISLFELILDNVEDNERIYQQPQTINDIKIDTIKTIIHCSINCKLNPKFGYQLFQIYREYSDDLIKNSINQLKKHQFLTLNKRQTEKNFTANWHIPLKFSYLFSTMKTTTYPLMLYREVYENFQLLLTNSNQYNFLTINELNTIWQQFEFDFDIPERGIVLNPNIDDHSEIIEEISKRFHLYLKRIAEENSEINENNTTETINQNNNYNIEDIKNRVIKLIFRVPYLIEGNLENNVKKLNDSQSSLEINNYLYLIIIDLKKFALDNCLSLKLKEFIKEINDDEAVIDNPTILLENLSKIVFSIQNLCIDDDCIDDFGSKFKQWQTDEELNFNDNENNVDNNNKIIETRKLQFTNKSMNNALDACIKNVLNGEIPTIDEIKIGIIEDLNNENRKIPHITDLTQFLIKERLENDDDIDDYDNIEQIKEHFIIKYPKLNHFEIINMDEFKNLQQIQELIQRNVGMKLQKCLQDFNRVKSPQLDKIVEYVRNLNGNDDDIDYVKNLINFIAHKKQFGANGDELKQNFLNKSTLCLIKLLNFLCSINIILRTGITQIVYVHYDYQSDWLVKTFIMPPEEQLDAESLKIDMKKRLNASDILQAKFAPWSKLDGTINEELLQEWLSLILSKCFDCPNITFGKLCEHFCFIKPVDLYFLLEVLQEIKCIDICVYNQIGNNIFSTRTIITDKPATCLDNFDEMFIKTKGISGLYFGSFVYNNSDSTEC